MYNDYMYIHDEFLLIHHLLGDLTNFCCFSFSDNCPKTTRWDFLTHRHLSDNWLEFQQHFMYIHDEFLLFHHLLGELHNDDLTNDNSLKIWKDYLMRFLDLPWANRSKISLNFTDIFLITVWSFLLSPARKWKYKIRLCDSMAEGS